MIDYRGYTVDQLSELFSRAMAADAKELAVEFLTAALLQDEAFQNDFYEELLSRTFHHAPLVHDLQLAFSYDRLDWSLFIDGRPVSPSVRFGYVHLTHGAARSQCKAPMELAGLTEGICSTVAQRYVALVMSGFPNPGLYELSEEGVYTNLSLRNMRGELLLHADSISMDDPELVEFLETVSEKL